MKQSKDKGESHTQQKIDRMIAEILRGLPQRGRVVSSFGSEQVRLVDKVIEAFETEGISAEEAVFGEEPRIVREANTYFDDRETYLESRAKLINLFERLKLPVIFRIKQLGPDQDSFIVDRILNLRQYRRFDFAGRSSRERETHLWRVNDRGRYYLGSAAELDELIDINVHSWGTSLRSVNELICKNLQYVTIEGRYDHNLVPLLAIGRLPVLSGVYLQETGSEVGKGTYEDQENGIEKEFCNEFDVAFVETRTGAADSPNASERFTAAWEAGKRNALKKYFERQDVASGVSRRSDRLDENYWGGARWGENYSRY